MLEAMNMDKKEGKDAEDNQKQEESAGSKVGTMKNGEYMLHVLIESAQAIDLEGEATVDPIIRVSFMGKTKDTTAKNDIARTT